MVPVIGFLGFFGSVIRRETETKTDTPGSRIGEKPTDKVGGKGMTGRERGNESELSLNPNVVDGLKNSGWSSSRIFFVEVNGTDMNCKSSLF